MNSKLLLLAVVIALLAAFSLAQTVYEQDLETVDGEQGKFWKKLGKALKKVIQGVDVSVSLEETETLEAFGNYMDKYSPSLNGLLTQDEVFAYKQVREIVRNCWLPRTPSSSTFDEDQLVIEQGFWKKVGNAIKKVSQNVNVSVSLDEEAEEGEAFWAVVGDIVLKAVISSGVDHAIKKIFSKFEEVELYDAESEVIVDSQGKFWKKLGNVLKKVVTSGSVTFDQEEEMTLRRLHKQTTKFAAIPMSQEDAMVLAQFNHKIGRITNRINNRGQVTLDQEDAIMEAERGKFLKKLGKALKKVIQNVDINVALDEESSDLAEQWKIGVSISIPFDEESSNAALVAEQGKFWKKLGNALKKVVQNVNVSVSL